MNRRFAIIYSIFATLILIACITSMLIIKREEEKKNREGKSKEKLDNISEYIDKNRVSTKILLKITSTGEIVSMDMDDYLKGVVPAEMPPSYDLEALKAQAVVARTYACEKMQSGGHVDCDICDNYAHCQAFYNKDKILEIWQDRGYDENLRNTYWSKVEEAVNSTNGIVATYKGEYIKAYFHANSGGKTESASEIWSRQNIPYLVSVGSLGEEEHTWYNSRVELSTSEIEEKLNKNRDKACNISVEKNTIEILSYTVSGRVNKIKIGDNIFDATELRTALGLKSTNFTVEINNNMVAFNVIGYGHGVGMSQTGSNYYAKNGMKYYDIIKHYYTGVDITKSG